MLALAPRLIIGGAEWRPTCRVAAAVQEWLASSLHAVSPDRPVWVAEADDHVVGVVTAGRREHWSSEHDAYVGELVVPADYAGHGVGGALMNCAETWARERGFGRLRLETGNANESAKVFYARLGYVIEEVVLTKAL